MSPAKVIAYGANANHNVAPGSLSIITAFFRKVNLMAKYCSAKKISPVQVIACENFFRPQRRPGSLSIITAFPRKVNLFHFDAFPICHET
jgi:hypothetical protein